MSKTSKFWFSGVISFIITFTFSILAITPVVKNILKREDYFFKSFVCSILAGLIVWFLVFLFHCILYLTGKRDFSFINISDSSSGEEISPERKKALYPPVPNYLLSDEPDGFMFGKQGKKYIRLPISRDNIMHISLFGAPGTGKSAGPLISTLISNFMKKKPPLTVFALDIKPELAKKSVNTKNNPYVKVVNPTDPKAIGWDIYYELNEDSTYDEIMDLLDYVADSLIICHDEKNKFFSDNAKNIFKGLMFFAKVYWNCDFMTSIQWILNNDKHKLILEVLKASEGQLWEIKVSTLLSSFSGKVDNAFNNIIMTMNENLGIFKNDIITYHLGDNPVKASPKDLADGISVFVSLPENYLEQYKTLLRLMVNQTIKFFEKRGDMQTSASSDGVILMIIDEFYRLNKMEMVVNALATLRSRGVSVILATQNISQLDELYGVSGRKNIIELCQCNLFLSGKDSENLSMFIDMAGDYYENTKSYSQSGGFLSVNSATSVNISQQKMPILTVKDFASLNDRKKVIAFCNGVYMQPDKLFYYKEKVLNEYSKNVIEVNQE